MAGRNASSLFAVTRVISWGDCDPAGIIYTPKAVAIAYEALGAWYRDCLGNSWWQTLQEAGLGSPTVQLSTRYLKPVRPDQAIDMTVLVNAVGRSSVTFCIVAKDEAGDICFTVDLTACCVDLQNMAATDIPPEVRSRFEAYLELSREASRGKAE